MCNYFKNNHFTVNKSHSVLKVERIKSQKDTETKRLIRLVCEKCVLSAGCGKIERIDV